MNRKTLSFATVIALFIGAIWCALTFTIENPRYDLILDNKNMLFNAFFTTIWVSITALFGALVLGFVIFVMNRSKNHFISAISTVFSEIIMGTPLLVMIFLVVYPFGRLIGSNDKLLLGIFAMIMYNAPYIANAYETTACVVTDEQYIVMDLFDFKGWQKYMYVILPQMVKPFIPSLVNNLSSVVKSSALLNIIAISEITYITTVISSKNYAIIEGYYVMWLMYLIVTIPLSILTKFIARRVK